MEWRERDGVRWLAAKLPGASAAFTTRLGGTSSGPFESLNLGLVTGDKAASVHANRARLTAALGLEPARVLAGFQVHGADLMRHPGPDPASPWIAEGEPARVDGHASDVPGLAPLVFVADCLPIALCGRNGVAMAHGGWRGLAGGIIERAAAEVEATAAAIGPGIGPCCYEVGDEVRARFAGLGKGIAKGRTLDLPAAAERLLREAGVDRVQRAELCTSCEPGLFFSHRRDRGNTGRQAGLIWRPA